MTDCLSPQLACGPAPAARPGPARPATCSAAQAAGEALGPCAPRGPWRGSRLLPRPEAGLPDWGLGSLWPVGVFLGRKLLTTSDHQKGLGSQTF